MRSLCIVLVLLGQFQVEELPVTNPEFQELSNPVFVVEELELPKEPEPVVGPTKIEEPPKSVEPPKQEVDTRPALELLGASWCSGCKSTRKAVDAISKETLPFTYSYRDVDSKGWLGAREIPAWAYNGRVFQYGFSTPEALMQNFDKFFRPKAAKAVQRLTPAELKAFAHSYTGPDVGVQGGNFWYHLQEGNHGFTAQQLNGLTQWECARIHGAHHNGYLTPFSIGGK